MIWKHRKTGKPALYITPYSENQANEDNPNCHRIQSWHDLPDLEYSKEFTIPHELWAGQGKPALYGYFQAFLKEDSGETVTDFWLLVMRSGFPQDEAAV